MSHDFFLPLVAKLRRRKFNAKRIIRDLQASVSFDRQHIFTDSICEQILSAESFDEACYKMCEFWQYGPQLTAESFFMVAHIARSFDEGLTRIIADHIAIGLANSNIDAPEFRFMRDLQAKYYIPDVAFANVLAKPLFGGIFPDNVASFFERHETEQILESSIQNLLLRSSNGALIIWGTGGIGKTTLANHILNPNSSFWIDSSRCPIQLDAVLWLNVCEMTMSQIYDEQGFFSALLRLFQSVNLLPKDCNREADCYLFQSVLNEKWPRILLILDDVFCSGVLRSISRISRGIDTFHCLVVTRNRSMANFSGLPSEYLEIETLSKPALHDILGRHYKLEAEKQLSNDQISGLVEICLGLPLIASVIDGHFRPLKSTNSIQKKYTELVTTLNAIANTQIQTDEKTTRHAQMTVSALLTFSPEFQSSSYCETYYTFLVFNAGEPVLSSDLAILWGLDHPDEVEERCQEPVNASMLRPCSDQGSQAFVVHDLLHKATVQRAELDLKVEGLSNVRSKLLARLLSENANALARAIAGERIKLVQIMLHNVSPSVLANLYISTHPCPFEVLFGYAAEKRWLVNLSRSTGVPISLDLFSRLTEIAAIEIFEEALVAFKKKNLFQRIPIKNQSKWFDNFLLASVRLSCCNLLRLYLKDEFLASEIVSSVDENGNNALMLASFIGSLEIVKILLERTTIDVNSQNKRGETALMRAATSLMNDDRRMAIARLLCSQQGFNANLVNNKGNSALFEAAIQGESPLVIYLLDECGADITICNRMNQANILEVLLSKYQRFDVCQILVEKGARIRKSAKIYLDIVKRADEDAREVREKIVQFLETATVDSEINPNNQFITQEFDSNDSKWRHEITTALMNKSIPSFDSWRQHVNDTFDPATGDTLLMAFSRSGSIDMVRMLLECGAHVEARNADEDTALILASQAGHFEVARALIELGQARIDVQNANGWSPLIWAARLGFNELAKYLLTQPGGLQSINFQNENDHTALIFASALNHFEIVKALVFCGASVDNQNIYGNSALYLASKNKPDIVKLLLDEAAPSVDAQNVKGWTALMMACHNGQLEIAKMLLDHNASIHVRPFDSSESLLKAARNSGNKLLVEMLMENGALEN